MRPLPPQQHRHRLVAVDALHLQLQLHIRPQDADQRLDACVERLHAGGVGNQPQQRVGAANVAEGEGDLLGHKAAGADVADEHATEGAAGAAQVARRVVQHVDRRGVLVRRDTDDLGDLLAVEARVDTAHLRQRHDRGGAGVQPKDQSVLSDRLLKVMRLAALMPLTTTDHLAQLASGAASSSTTSTSSCCHASPRAGS
ncbi:hypothetical protein TYRP_007744 [Tyrophagus putrescentiae]|nr:hypothetical protein TYRP_007744 [Tyrophagus putrescentiae]